MLVLQQSQSKVESDSQIILEQNEDDELVHVDIVEGKSDKLLASKACADKYNLLCIKT